MLMKRKRVVRGDKPAGSGGWASAARTCFGGLRLLRYGQEKLRTYKTGLLRAMSVESKPELPNAHGHEFTAVNAPGGSTPEAEATPAVANFG